MPVDFSITCLLPHGFHARPASHVAAIANTFTSECALTNLRSGSAADMKSVLSIIAADIRFNDACSVRVQGVDEAQAAAALQRFIENDLAVRDSALPDLLTAETRRELPRALRLAGVQVRFGQAASRGIGAGKAAVIGGIQLHAPPPEGGAHDPALEEQRIHHAVAGARTRIQSKLLEPLSSAESGILEAYLAILSDAALTGRMLERIRQGDSAAQAIVEANTFFADKLRRSDNSLLRERALDIHGICRELLDNISGIETATTVELRQPSVVVAESLAPQQLLALDRKWIRGMVMESAGTTSHTVILARSLGIPTVVAVKDVLMLPAEAGVVVDANRGLVILESTPPVKRFYERESRTMQRRKEALARYATSPARTADARTIGVSASVASAEEIDAAFQSGADGIGVFRTEMLFLKREQPPSEEEQFEIYAHAARAAAGKPVVIRTLDVGGDKPLRFVRMPAEDNPFLGYRGVRIYQENAELLRTQLRAIVRASAAGRVRVMAPMVSTLEEVLWFKEQVAEVQRELKESQIAFDPSMPVGTMIEIPSSAFILDPLANELDFFSLGTNDLSQYFFAADRGNPRVAKLANARHPAFLKFLQQIVHGVKTHGKSASVCGDMAADLRSLPLLIGLGLEEISVPVPDVTTVKERISRHSYSECRKLLSEVLACPLVQDAENLLECESARSAGGLLSAELIVLGTDIRSKEEAIRELVDVLYVEGRTDDPDRLEDAVWARESVYSTGMGHGFAVPHCKSDAVNSASIAILKLKEPVDWNPLDGKPVEIVIFLAARESDAENEHLRVFSQLARNLMDDDFREQLVKAGDREAIFALLNKEFSQAV